MSGGSYNYSYNEVEHMARVLQKERNPLRVAFGRHLLLVAKAMHDVEWVDSGDYGEEMDVEAIKNVLGVHWRELIVAEALDQIEAIKEELLALLEDNEDV